jgi:hypothetical protein
VESARRGSRGPRWYGRKPPFALISENVCSYISFPVALKDDDADDEEPEAEEATRTEAQLAAKEEQNAKELAAKPKIKQPTGKVVGVIKRNWRA